MLYPQRLFHGLALVSTVLVLSLPVLLATGCVSAAKPAAPVTAAQPDPRFEIPATDDGLPGAGPIRRNKWFQKTWSDRRKAFAATASQDDHALVFLGDSITQGWKDLLGSSFPGVKVANRGISGDTTRGVLIRLQEDVILLHPTGVVLLIGTNDLEDKAEPWTVATNTRLIIDALTKYDAKMPVVLCEVMPSSLTKKRSAGRIKRTNQLLIEAVRDQPQVTLLDTWNLFANAEGDAKAEEFPDLLHPNAAGYAKWAAGLHTILATLGFMDNEPDVFTPEPGYVSLFNGHDLTGWGFQPTTEADIQSAKRWQKTDPGAAEWPIITEAVSFDGLTATPDGRYVAKNGRLIVTTPHEYRKIQQLWTTRQFPQNFVLRLEFRSAPNADSGIFVRGPQLQCRDYLIAGPYKKLEHYRAQDWNEIEITVKDGAAHCTCNGELLEEAMKVPATGSIGLEGDRGQMEYRRIRILEQP